MQTAPGEMQLMPRQCSHRLGACRVMNHDLLEVDPPVARDDRKRLLYALAGLLQELPLITVQGLATVQRAVVKADTDAPGRSALGLPNFLLEYLTGCCQSGMVNPM